MWRRSVEHDRTIEARQAEFLNEVAEAVAGVLTGAEFGDSVQSSKLTALRRVLTSGKMLRSRLGWALSSDADRELLISACAATELLHSATLFHDDVIDGASIRRSNPTLWREIGTSGAILVGDMCFTSALGLLVDTGDLEATQSFIAKVKEVCAAEISHEIGLRAQELTTLQAIDVARGKTGPLFAFVAGVCGSSDRGKALAFEEVGYRLGAVYQLADDLLDEYGDEVSMGKTLGTDRKRSKYTMAQSSHGAMQVEAEIERICDSVRELVRPWPEQAEKVDHYIQADLLPAWRQQMQKVG
jgi:octaprenyl-diphosphate synthase